MKKLIFQFGIITWRSDSTEVFSIKINALTGKVISKEINEVRE